MRSVEISLAGFQRDLGSVSTEIETLQMKSTTLNTRLENRKVVEEILGPAVEEISIAPSIVKNIIDGQIDEVWLKSIAELQKKIKINDSKNEGSEAVKAAADTKPLLDGLTTKVHLLELLYASKMSNAARLSNVYETTLLLKSRQFDLPT